MTRPKVVIVGGGFGGLYAARALGHAPVDVLLVDRSNHHLFQPLLYQVATATLSATDVAAPLRWLLRKQTNTDVLMADVDAIDPASRTIRLVDGTNVRYDYLILAPGARHAYPHHPEWERVAPGLKSLDDALEIRRRFLSAFESADRATDPASRTAWMTIVIVGGGPTGVELAGMIPTVARHALPSDFRHIDTTKTRVVLIEGGPRLLPAFPEDLSDRARRDLEELGVEIRTGTLVSDVSDTGVTIGADRIDARTVFWAAGNKASPLGGFLGATLERDGRIRVDPTLQVPGHSEIFIAGDLALMVSDGKQVPGVAPAAMQSGRAAANNIVRILRNQEPIPFRYRNKGDLATIGRFKAVAVIAGLHLAGAFAWWTWLFVHILYLAGFRNRLSVLVEWGYSFFTYERGARIITGEGDVAPK